MLAEDTYQNIDEALNLIDDAAGDMSGVGPWTAYWSSCSALDL